MKVILHTLLPMQEQESSENGFSLIAFFVLFICGLSFVATKELYACGFTPVSVLLVRCVLAWLLMFAFSSHRFKANSITDEVKFAVMGLLSVPIALNLENQALAVTQVSVVAPVIATAPLMCAIVVLMRWRHFKLHWMTKLGFVAAATGVLLIAFDAGVMQNLPQDGLWMALCASFALAVCTAVGRSLTGYCPEVVTRKTLGWGIIFLLPFVKDVELSHLTGFNQPEAVFAMLLLVMASIPSVLSSTIESERMNRLYTLKRYFWIVTLSAMIFAAVFQDESFSFIGLMGTIMVLCGVWSADTGLKRINAVFAGVDWHRLSARLSF